MVSRRKSHTRSNSRRFNLLIPRRDSRLLPLILPIYPCPTKLKLPTPFATSSAATPRAVLVLVQFYAKIPPRLESPWCRMYGPASSLVASH